MNRVRAVLHDPAIIPKRLKVKFEFMFWQAGWRTSPNCAKLEALKDAHAGRRAFIVGNGPSLHANDLQVLHEAGEISFASNKIFLIYPDTEWRPTYYCAQDIPFGQKFRQQIWQQEEHTKLLLPNIFHEQKLATRDSLRFFLDMRDRYPGLTKFGTSPARFYFAGTVTYTFMQWAYYMGLREIILLGVDADYRSAIQNEILDKMIVTNNVRSHFTENYFDQGEEHHAFNVNKQIRGYESAKKFADVSGMKILNATRGGKLDVFERVSFDSLFD